MNMLLKRANTTKASLLAEVKEEARRVGKIVGRRQQGYIGQVRRRNSSHNPLSILDGWVSAAATMHSLGFGSGEVLSLGGDGAIYRPHGDYYQREDIDHYSVEALTKLLEAIRQLEH